MKHLPWILLGLVGIGGAGATIYFVSKKTPAQVAQQTPQQGQGTKPQDGAGGGGQPNWGAIATGAGQAVQGITGLLGNIFGGNG